MVKNDIVHRGDVLTMTIGVEEIASGKKSPEKTEIIPVAHLA